MRILVTGCCGFIGYHLSKRLLECGYTVIGIDNFNNYYDPQLKYDRCSELIKNERFYIFDGDITDYLFIDDIFSGGDIDAVYNLAAYAGVPYSIKNPLIYNDNNVKGFYILIDKARKYGTKKFFYASSSSVYGGCGDEVVTVSKSDTNPLNIYGLSKLINEQTAKVYSELYDINTVGCRFFNVGGSWGRPDGAIYKWTKALYDNTPIILNNYGNMWRDFTYVGDVVNILVRLINVEYDKMDNVINIGKGDNDKLTDVVDLLEKITGKFTTIYCVPCPEGEIISSLAGMDETLEFIGCEYKPVGSLETILTDFVEWYRDYYKK